MKGIFKMNVQANNVPQDCDKLFVEIIELLVQLSNEIEGLNELSFD